MRQCYCWEEACKKRLVLCTYDIITCVTLSKYPVQISASWLKIFLATKCVLTVKTHTGCVTPDPGLVNVFTPAQVASERLVSIVRKVCSEMSIPSSTEEL